MFLKSFSYVLATMGVLTLSLPTIAEYYVVDNDTFKLGVGGYARVYSGKLESMQYNTVLKAEPKITAQYNITDDLSLKGKFSYRIVRDDRFVDKKVSKVYDAYGTIASKKLGSLDVGKLRSVGYALHQGAVDVSSLDVDDSDISYFYKTPKNFYAPTLTYLYTDSRDPKVSYTTPEINGLTWGLSVVQPEDKKADSIAPYSTKIDHGKGIITAAKYQYDFGNDIWATASAGFAYYHNDTFFKGDSQIDANHREYSLGANVGIKNITLGAAYKRIMFPDKIAVKDSQAFSTGVAYKCGKYSTSLSWLHSQAELIDKDTYNHIMFSNKYEFTKYLDGFISVGQLEFSNNKGMDDRRWFGIAGIQLKI